MQQQDEWATSTDEADDDNDPMDTLRSHDMRELMQSTEHFDTLRSEDLAEVLNLSTRPRHQDDDGDCVMSS